MPERMLRLLSLLQSRRDWPGAELATRLGVTDRTVRRDVERLRELGYPVEGTTGIAGGYRLASGRNLPPLLLDDEEAVAIAVGLGTAATGSVSGIEDSSVRALAKLEQVLPARLRGRVAAVGAATTMVPDIRAARADPAVLVVLAAADREHEVVTFDYRRRDGTASTRRVEPHGLVASYGRWYLVAFDTGRADWRSFRVDRISDPVSTRHRFTPRALPAKDPADFVRAGLTTAEFRYTATAVAEASAEAVRERIPLLLPGNIEPLGGQRCRIRLTADDPERIARDLVALGADFTLDAPAELLDHLRAAGKRLLGAGQPTSSSNESSA